MTIIESSLIVSFDHLVTIWGAEKVTRLSHIENSEDRLVLRERIIASIYDTQCQLFGFFGLTRENSPDDLVTYLSGILPVFLEYRLNPTEALKDSIDMLYQSMASRLKQQQPKVQSLDIEPLIFVV